MILTPPSHYDPVPYANTIRTHPTTQSDRYPAPLTQYENGGLDVYHTTGHHLHETSSTALQQSFFKMPEVRSHALNRLIGPQNSSKNYATAPAPVLPPIQIPRRSSEGVQHMAAVKGPSVVAQPPKEEKMGGVAAHLDYKIDEMIDFVSEMAQGMYGIFVSKICLADIDMTRSVMSAKSAVHPDLRRYVHQVLTSTRLPSSTILLALHYLAVRMTLLSERGRYSHGGGDIHNMLTTALMLGSKFLDDNTFQNRSWSDVSSISVSKLNMLELDWLIDIKWEMHFDPSDPKGFALWQRRWRSFQNKKLDVLAESMKRTSLEHSLQPQYPLLQLPRQTPLSLAHYQAGLPEINVPNQYVECAAPQWQTHYDQWRPSRHPTDYSPPSAPETGPSTPDHAYPNNFGYGHMLPPIYPAMKPPAPALHIPASSAVSSGFSTPYTPQYYYPTHGHYCGCNLCVPHSDRYMVSSNYGQVMA